MKKTAIAFILATASVLALAQTTPAGVWRTIDDDGKTEKSIVRIVNAGGVYSGKVEKITDPAKAAEKCVDCEGAAKDQPIIGLTIISDVKQNGDDAGVYDGGTILDPAKGKTYKVRLKPIDGGKKLEVRGYIGSPVFGRTQTWVRAE
jgi:uncharacterized protein (DUF2147 family)